MKANYGYQDGSGEYYIAIDTDLCNGCGKCAATCPKGIFQVTPDDYDKDVARVRESLTRSIGMLCPGYERCRSRGPNCHSVCPTNAIEHSW